LLSKENPASGGKPIRSLARPGRARDSNEECIWCSLLLLEWRQVRVTPKTTQPLVLDGSPEHAPCESDGAATGRRSRGRTLPIFSASN
jgi:hypothetical protein